MTSRQCTRLWQIDAYREGRLGSKDADSFVRHLRACAACSARMESDERLRTRARALPVDEPNKLALHRLRGRVLRDAAAGVGPSLHASMRRVWAVVVLVAACASLLALAMNLSGRRRSVLATAPKLDAPIRAPDPPAPALERFAGTIVGDADGRWSQAREQRHERVDLEEGTIHVHVRPQEADERFLVVMPDGELEVRGTTFDVSVRDGKTAHVDVQSGVVELRLRRRGVIRLLDGDTWRASPAASSSPQTAYATAPARAVPASSADIDDGVSSYAAAMQRLRDGHYEEAAAVFHGFAATWPRSSQAEDASFLEAVALARAGRPDAAGLAAERHLASFPQSFHRKEAAVLVGRAAALRGECDKARTALGPWLGPSPDSEATATMMRGCDGR